MGTVARRTRPRPLLRRVRMRRALTINRALAWPSQAHHGSWAPSHIAGAGCVTSSYMRETSVQMAV